ncbi:MAG: hypothetical protein HPY74_08145 [Firmicutes bacterium]|nr:hypothetical protein [Bacillota bacterium]
MDRHFVYHELLDCMESDGCPICMLINKNIDRFIDGLLYESVNDIKIRDNINKAKGFCNYHAWRLQQEGDPLAHSIIYGDLVNTAIKEIESFLKETEGLEKAYLKFSNRSNHMLKQLKHSLNGEAECPLCKMVEESEKVYITSMTEYIFADKEFNIKFQKNSFMCVPHMLKMLEYCSSLSSIKTVLKIQLERFKEMSGYLSEIKRKSDYRFFNEPHSSEEKKAWITAVKLWVGEKGTNK